MRKIIASLLAGATVLSMASMMTFATIDGTKATFTMDVSGTVANGKTYEVALNVAGGSNATQTTAATSAATTDNLAAEIRKLNFDGWTLSGNGSKVVFTANEKADTKYTGVTATVKQTDDQSTNAKLTLSGNITQGKADITVTTVTLAGNDSINNEVDQTVKLTATINDASGDVTSKIDKSQITWNITAPTDAAEKGKIEVKDGTVKIKQKLAEATKQIKVTATCDGKTSTEKVINVAAAPGQGDKVTSITVNGPAEVKLDSTATYTAAVLPESAKNKDVEWTVTGGNNKATITAQGVLDPKDNVAGATLTVKATAKDGSNVFGEKVVTVTDKDVTPPAEKTKLVIKGLEKVKAGATVTLTAVKEKVVPQTRAAETYTWTMDGEDADTQFVTAGSTTRATSVTTTDPSVQLKVGANQDVSKLVFTVSSTEANVDPSGNQTVPIAGTASQTLTIVDGDGNVIATGATVQPDSTVYAKLDSVYVGVDPEDMADKDMFKIDVKKATGSKVVKKVSVDEEKINGARTPVIKIELKELFDDSDNKVVLEVNITPKKDALDRYTFLKNEKLPMNDIKFYVSNTVDNADQDYQAGKGGVVLKPTANEDNEIIWSDENRDLVRLTFEGDSDVTKIYPKLSTKWDSQYNDIIGNADAFLYDFVGHPSISSTSRATLEIYNPFYNDDTDKFDVNIEDIMIYEEIDGELVDITDRVTAGTNEDGDQVLTMRTRTLGKYIITDGTAIIDTGIEDEVPEEEIPSEKPSEGGKPNPGTGF